MRVTPPPLAVRVAGIYLAVGVLWIVLSDIVLAAFTRDVATLSMWQTVKGWVFIAVTAVLVYLLVRRAEARLRMVAEAYKALVEAAPVGIWRLDREGRVEHWNRAAERIFGWSAAEVDGASVPIVQGAEQLEEFRRLLDRMLAGESLHEIETRRTRKDGTRIDVSISGAPIRDRHGRVVACTCVVADVTERLRVEKEVRALNARLEARVAERTARLEALNAELEAFTYSVSHDLKAPLRGIDGYSRLLLEEHADRLDEDARVLARNVRDGARRMEHLIEDLLSYSRLERRELHVEEVELHDVATEVARMLEGDCRERGVALRVTVAPGLTARADRAGLEQALRNLADNSIKFTREVDAPEVEIGGRVEGDRRLVWVRDNGVGFDMDFHDRIFEIFHRLHRAEEYPGTGIGLALVRKTMERMGGRVRAESTPGAGATFYLELPA